MALKKVLPREQRLQKAKIWIPTYNGKNIVRGYKKHFALSILAAVADLKLLGYEFTDEYIENLKIDEVNRCTMRKFHKENNVSGEDMSRKSRKFKNHEFVDGKLLQINKKFCHLKQSQKSLIADWIRIEYTAYFEKNGKIPSKKDQKESVIDAVYERIKEGEIWIPYGEIKKYFCKKQTKIRNKLLQKSEDIAAGKGTEKAEED